MFVAGKVGPVGEACIGGMQAIHIHFNKHWKKCRKQAEIPKLKEAGRGFSKLIMLARKSSNIANATKL